MVLLSNRNSLQVQQDWQGFVARVASGEDPKAAAEASGFDPRSVSTLLGKPAVRKALVEAAQTRLQSRALPLALATIEQILTDEEAPVSVKGKLAVAIYDRATKAQEEADKGAKPLEDMTPEQLRSFLDQAAKQGVILDVTPGNAQQSNDPIS